MMTRAGWLVLTLATATLGACAEGRKPKKATSFAAAVTVELPDDQLPARRPLVTMNGRRTGGALVGAYVDDERVLLVADADARALRIVNADTHAERFTHSLRGTPSQVVVGGDGRAYVSLRDRAEVLVLELVPGALALEEIAAIEVAAEPVALAVSPRGERLVVASGWAAKLASFEIPSRRRAFEVDTPREPRAVAITSDGMTAMVTHAVGSEITRVNLAKAEVAALSLAGTDHQTSHARPWDDDFCCFGDFNGAFTGEPEDRAPSLRVFEPKMPSGLHAGKLITHRRGAAQGYAIAAVGEEFVAPGVLTHRGPSSVGSYGIGEGYPAHQPVLAHIRDDVVHLRVEGTAFEPSEHRTHPKGSAKQCLLPRAADSDGTRVFVTCLGTDRVVAYDGTEPRPLGGSREGMMRVPAGPTGVVVDGDWVHVWSQYTQTLSSMRGGVFVEGADNENRQPERMTKLVGSAAKPQLSRLARHGRTLFHASGDRRISADGRACASCHPDGRDDMMTWPTPHGARQTPMLAGRLGKATSPYGWQGKADTLATHLTQTFARLGGRGLKGEELDALLAYLDEMPSPAMSSPTMSSPTMPSANDDRVARGKELFFADTVGCASCHQDAIGSDGSRHDVGSGVKLDTPSLRFVSGTAPYFHDGRYATLGDMLRATKGKMGWAADMNDDDIAALEAYLMTL